MTLQTPCRLPAMGHRPLTTKVSEPLQYLAALACFLLLLPGAVSAQTQQTPSIPVPPTFFADHLVNNTNWFTVPTGALGKGTGVNWAYSEPQRGVYNWSTLDAWVAKAQAHNVDYFFSNDQIPQWAASNPNTCSPTYPGSNVIGCTSGVSNIQDWDDFVTALVTRYKGKIQIYELWNEPNSYFTGTYAEMVQLTQHMHDIIRAIDPKAIIVAPSYTCSSASFPEYTGCRSSLDGYLNAGGVTDVDVVSLHAYPHHENQVAEAVLTSIGTYQQIMAKHGLAGKELWDTEASWGDSSYTTCCQTASADQQVAFLARHYLLHWSAGVTRYYWYSWDNSGWGTLWDKSGGTHPAGVAYGQLYNWMVGATMTQSCAIQSGTVWTCTLTRPNGYTGLVVWNTAGNSTYNAPSNFTTFRDLAGKSSSITGALTIGPKPILLEDQGSGSGSLTPIAVLAVTPQNGTAPVTVNADSTGSYETSGTIASRSIDFGDGTVVSTATASHTYNSAGTYTVKLTVTDATGISASATKTVAVTAQSLTPTAVLNVSPQTGTAPVTVNADSTGSNETGGSIASRSIDFGDGTVVGTATASHTYNSAGSYVVKLTVTDVNGTSASTTKTVTVTAQTLNPVAVLNVSPQSGTAPVTVNADSTSSYETGGTIASRKIDFGDGTVVATATASHTYNSAGTFTVTLTVTDAGGKTASATNTVSVSAPAAPTPTAMLNVTPQSGTAPLYVTADSSSSYETGGNIVSRTIDFGDGTVVTSTNAAHSYATPGNYVITVTVKDALGTFAKASKGVSVQSVVSSPCSLSTSNRTVIICSPTSTSSSSVQINATATDRLGVKQMYAFIDGRRMMAVKGSPNLRGSIYMSRGMHTLTVMAVDASNVSFSSSTRFYIQ